MIIKKIEIGSFGKFYNYTLSLKDKAQIIYGMNEQGKSTLMEFIKIMLYGRRKGNSTAAEDKILRAKYFPWDGKSMKGALEFEHSGCIYRVQKHLDKSSVSKDEVLLQNLSLGTNIDLGKREEVGEYFFDMDLKSFERSSYVADVGKSGFESSGSLKDNLADKIINLSATGDEEISATAVMEKISEAIKDLERAGGKNGKIPHLKLKINALTQEIENLKFFQNEQAQILFGLEKTEKLREEEKSLQATMEKICDLHKTETLEKIIPIIKNQENWLEEIKFMGIDFLKIQDISDEFTNLKNEITSYESRIYEVKNFAFPNNSDFVSIDSGEMEFLEAKLKEKENTESKMQNIKLLCGGNLEYIPDFENFDKYFEAHTHEKLVSFAEDFKILSKDTETLKKSCDFLNENLKMKNQKKELLTCEFQEKEKIFSRKKRINIFCLICAVVAGTGLFLLAPAVFGHIAVTGLCVMGVWGFLNIKSRKKDLNSIKEKINELSCKSEIHGINDAELKIGENTKKSNNIKNNIFQIVEKEINILNDMLCGVSEEINLRLKEKNVVSVQEYYKNYAKSQNLFQNKLLYRNLKEKCEDLKLKFIKKASCYKYVSCYSQAMLFLSELINQKQNLSMETQKIKYELGLAGINLGSSCELQKYLNVLKARVADGKKDIARQDIHSVKRRLEELKLMNLAEEYIELKKSIKSFDKNPEILKKELECEKEKLSQMQNYFESLKTARETIEEVSAELRKNFSPKLNKEASCIFEKITSGKYKNIYIRKNYDVMIEHSMMHRICDNFSSGTLDQAYLSLRLAISNLISCDKKVPLILDDVFMRYDDSRICETLNFLKNHSERFQTIIFSCHNSVVTSGIKENIEIINLK